MKKIKELESKIIQARIDYYNNQAKVSDRVFDAWIDELSELDPKNLAVIGIGSDPVSNWDKYTHKSMMGSLNKVQTHDEFIKWSTKYIDKGDEFFLTLKLDGLSVSLIYENGKLVKASTRGSGKIGELITQNVAKMIGVPLRIKNNINATIRGEICLSKENHKKFFKDYTNPRNGASGISRRYDGVGSEHLTVLVYQLESDDIDVKTYSELFDKLTEMGFKTPDYKILKTEAEVKKIKDKYQESMRDKYFVELDGLVIHNNNLEKIAAHGDLHSKPYASIAYKFDSVAKEAIIAEIMLQTGSSGRITPVAVFNPKVNLAGADVERASLHNFTNIAELGVDIGCKVLVCRSNDVIPFIEEVTESTGTVFQPPTHCPTCGAMAAEDGEYYKCTNLIGCPSQLSGKLRNWLDELNILEWGDKLLENLIDSKKAITIADLYKLKEKDIANLDRMGEKSAKKCLKLLWETTEIPLDILIGGLSIPMVGASTIKLIMNHGADSLEKLGKLKAHHFEQVGGVGPIKAKSLEKGLIDNKDLILELLSLGIKIKAKSVGKLTGKSICITGSTNLKRSILEKMASDYGADVKSSVGSELSYLIIADPNSTSSKAIKARALGTKLISEDEFLDMVK